MRRIIAIHGFAGSGKTTASDILGDGKAIMRPFAKPIKDIATQMGWDGKKDAKGRRLLQLLGTQVGRQCIHPDIWVRKWSETLDQVGSFSTIICDDLRFQNEYDHLVSIKVPVTFIHIRGRTSMPWYKRILPHASERGIKFRKGVPLIVIDNDGSLDDFKRKIHDIL